VRPSSTFLAFLAGNASSSAICLSLDNVEGRLCKQGGISASLASETSLALRRTRIERDSFQNTERGQEGPPLGGDGDGE